MKNIELFQQYPDQPSGRELYLDALAAEYHTRTEAYDRSVCTGPIEHGEIQPATDAQFVAINKNARNVLLELCARASRDHGFTSGEVRKAINRYKP